MSKALTPRSFHSSASAGGVLALCLWLTAVIFPNLVSAGCDQSCYGVVMVPNELSCCFVGLKGMRVISYCWYWSALTSWNHHSLLGRVLLCACSFAVGGGYPKPSLICARCVPCGFSNANVWAMLSFFEREFHSLVNLCLYQSLTINPLFFQILVREAVLEPNPFTLCCVTNNLPFPESRDKAKMDTCAYSAEQWLLFLWCLHKIFQRIIFSPCKHSKKDYFQGSSVLKKKL